MRGDGVVVAGISKRNGHPISFWEFTRDAAVAVVAVVTVAIATPYLLLRY